MPRLLDRQKEGGTGSRESIFGDAVPFNGVEDQAARRAHMREQTTARQAAERHLGYPPIPREDWDYRDQVAERLIAVRAELALINATHQTWLRAHGEEEQDAHEPLRGPHGVGVAIAEREEARHGR